MPEIIGNLGKVSFFGPKDPMAMTLKEVGIVSSKEERCPLAQEEDVKKKWW